jgi:hypothetical protein
LSIVKRRSYVMCPPAPDALSYDVATTAAAPNLVDRIAELRP